MATKKKGDSIRFFSGKYVGKTGWFNVAEIAGKTVPVIVTLGRGKGEKATIRKHEQKASHDPTEKKPIIFYLENNLKVSKRKRIQR